MYYFVFINEAINTPKERLKQAQCISRHRSHSAAYNKANKMNSYHDGLGSITEVLESNEENTYEIGKRYPKLIQEIIDQRELDWFVSLMVQILRSENEGEDLLNLTLEHIADTGLELLEFREKYEAKAISKLDDDIKQDQELAARKARVNAVSNELVDSRSEITYTFPAVRGVQAKREFYSAIVAYKYLVKLFVFDSEDIVPAELRAQRNINHNRAKKLGQYIQDNPDTYVLPAITASISKEMIFESHGVAGSADRLGLLHIPMDAVFLLNDGQHRLEGIRSAIKENPKLKDETICVTIYFDCGLQRSQQMFADINSNQVKPSGSINALYNSRCPFNNFIQDLLNRMPLIKSKIEMETSSVGKKSMKLWSLIGFSKFITQLTGLTANSYNDIIDSDSKRDDLMCLIEKFMSGLNSIPNWKGMIESNISAFDVRESMVISHAVFLEALGVMGRILLQMSTDSIAWKRLDKLSKVDPNKSSAMWDNRCVVLGRMQKTSDGVKGTAVQLVELTGLTLTPDLESVKSRLKQIKAA
ncbi:MAG: DNA sulfur modification protein DndB [Pseudomonadota bacterium]